MTPPQHYIASFGISDTGLCRTSDEDHFMIAALTRQVVGVRDNAMLPALLYHEVGACGTVLAVAAGLGGYEGGDIASRLAVEATVQACFDSVTEQLPPAGQLNKAIEISHRALCDQRQHTNNHPRVASTLTAGHISHGTLTVARVGDSRAYLFRDGCLALLTEAQSLINLLQKQGLLTEEEAARHPERHIILQALGQGEGVVPEVYVFSFQHDVLMGCRHTSATSGSRPSWLLMGMNEAAVTTSLTK